MQDHGQACPGKRKMVWIDQMIVSSSSNYDADSLRLEIIITVSQLAAHAII